MRRDGWSVTIFRRGNGFKAVLSSADKKIFLPQVFATADEAKLAAYDAMHAAEAASTLIYSASIGGKPYLPRHQFANCSMLLMQIA